MGPRLCALLVLAAVGCKKGGSDDAAKAPPAPVKVALATAVEKPTPLQITLTGIIAADQRAEVTADVAGKVLGVKIERGDHVKQGDAVVQLDVQTAALGAREAQANLANARAQRELAEEECKRTKTLLDKGAITRSEYDRQTTQCTSALQQVSAAEARAMMMSKSVRDGLVRAPFDGIVAEKSVTPGEWVAPGRPLFTLVDTDPLRIELSVPEISVRAVKVGQTVELKSVAFPDETYTATVQRVGAEVGRTRSLIVEAVIDKPKAESGAELVPGMFAEAHLTIGQTDRAVIPAQAVTKRAKTWHVFVVNNGELEDRVVQLGPQPTADTISISQNLRKDDKVVADVCEKGCPCGYHGGKAPPKGCQADPKLIDGLRVVE